MPTATQTPWNVVFILADDLGWTDLGCYGSDYYQTPNLDRLAADGMRFTQNYSACNACSPTRSALMTGMYPARTHLTDWIPGWKGPRNAKLLPPPGWTQRLEHRHTTIAEALRDGGYATYHIGKWHLGKPGWYPEDSGFDVNIAGAARGSPPSYHYPYKGLAERWHSHLTETERKDLYLTDRLAGEAAALVEKAKGRPFFMYLSFHAVHTPIQGRSDLVAKYKQLPPGKHHKNAVYAAMVEAVDEAVGRVRTQIEKAGIAGHTLIVFTSDNGGLFRQRGYATGNAPLRGGKGQQWEGGIRVPAIVHWPGVTKPGSVCNEPIITMDFYPTLLEITGVPGNPEHSANVDGLSLVNLLKDADAPLKRDTLYWHYPHYNVIRGIPHSIIRAGNYKLITYYEDDHIELYNLAEDIGEQRNLAESHPLIAKRLHTQLRDHLEKVGAQMPVPNPHHTPR
ncbi:MAG: sulfatase [Lentisphaerae bacterium]|nr:sulfatase [Lentisphaerota bacterium]MBT7844232.1 sulfatase [Lentisphaerota bacterium]